MTPHELEQTLGRNLRSVRVARGLTQVELADLANISVGALKHLESGAGSTTATLAKALRALGSERWIESLAPAPNAFNPLDLLEARAKQQSQPTPRRARRRGTIPT